MKKTFYGEMVKAKRSETDLCHCQRLIGHHCPFPAYEMEFPALFSTPSSRSVVPFNHHARRCRRLDSLRGLLLFIYVLVTISSADAFPFL